MSYSAIRDQIETELKSITGIGNVHDYERLQNVEKTVVTFKKSGAVCAEWTITRQSTIESTEDYRIIERSHVFIIRGYYPLNDKNATEKTFQDLVEDVMAHFRYLDTLSDTVFTQKPLELVVFEPRAFGNTLVHYAEIKLDLLEKIVL